jgi:hypothetical protein
LCAKGLNTKDIHKEMFPVNGETCLPRKAVHNSVKKLGRRFADDEDFETEVADNSQRTPVLLVSTHW